MIRGGLVSALLDRSVTRRRVIGAAAGGAAAAGLGTGATLVAAQGATPTMCPATTPAENVAVVRRWFDEVVSGHDLTVLDEILAPAAAQRSSTFPGPRDPRANAGAILAAFPDARATVDQVVAEGDLVGLRFTTTGTHLGEFQGYAPTGRSATWSGITVVRLECGRIAETWLDEDALGRLRQLGLLPGSPAALPGGATPVAAPVGASPAACPAGTPEENKALVERYWAEVWGAHDAAAASGLLAEDELHHWGVLGDTVGHAPFAARLDGFLAAFPDLTVRVDQLVAEGDLVLSRWTETATHQGKWMGVPATGAPVEWTGMNIFRIACGKIAESWGAADHLGLLRQVGGAPGASTPAAGTPAA